MFAMFRENLPEAQRNYRRFQRVQSASIDEKQDFLAIDLKLEFPEVQLQAARKLAELGQLEILVRELLIEFVRGRDPELCKVAVIGLEHIDFAFKDLVGRILLDIERWFSFPRS